MKCSIVAIVVCFALSFHACQEVKEDLKTPISLRDLYKKIGQEIPFETGMEWIEYYKLVEYNKSQNVEGGKAETTSPYNVTASELKRMLQSTPDLIGVAIHYGIDELGEKHFILIPVDGSLRLWSSSVSRVFLDANTGQEISQDKAYYWAQNYKNAHPDSIWFHFFGSDIFDEITALPYFNNLDIEPAINVLDLTPQLLLIVWIEDIISTGRTSDESAKVYDASNACPPCAAQ